MSLPGIGPGLWGVQAGSDVDLTCGSRAITALHNPRWPLHRPRQLVVPLEPAESCENVAPAFPKGKALASVQTARGAPPTGVTGAAARSWNDSLPAKET